MGNIYFAGGSGGGVDPDDCTATPAQVLEGHTAGVNGYDDPVEGTMPYQKQEGTLNCGQSSIILPGYHDGTRSITANSLASQTPGTASAANIYPGQTAWVNGNRITGTMATQGGGTYTAGTADKTVVAANRFVTGNVVVKGDANLTAGNIKKGVKIMGITGSWEGYVPTATDLYLRGNNVAGWACILYASLHTGGIYISPSSSNLSEIKTAKSYNLTSYKKLNITINISEAGQNWVHLVGYYNSNILLGSIDKQITLNTDTTLSIDVSNIANVIKDIDLRIRGYHKTDKGYVEYGLKGYIYHIWLS